jgi:hypothetical protein
MASGSENVAKALREEGSLAGSEVISEYGQIGKCVGLAKTFHGYDKTR